MCRRDNLSAQLVVAMTENTVETRYRQSFMLHSEPINYSIIISQVFALVLAVAPSATFGALFDKTFPCVLDLRLLGFDLAGTLGDSYGPKPGTTIFHCFSKFTLELLTLPELVLVGIKSYHGKRNW